MLDRYARKKKKKIILERLWKPQLHDSATDTYVGLVYGSHKGTKSSCNTFKLVDTTSYAKVQDFCCYENQGLWLGEFGEHGKGSEESLFLLLLLMMMMMISYGG